MRCPGGEIGRRTRFRFWRRNTWEFESPLGHQNNRGLRQWSDYQAHNLKAGGSNPSPATKHTGLKWPVVLTINQKGSII